jgi:rRNA maturation protein Rpf1
MSSLYLSTGRKPSQQARKLARLLSLILKSEYENRGKRSVDEICSRAEKSGCTRIAFIYEKKGNPSHIQFYDEENAWLPEEIKILGIFLPERKGRGRIPRDVQLIGEDETGIKMMQLLNLENDIDDGKSPLIGKFSTHSIAFFLQNEKILEIKCKLAIQENKDKPE